MCIRDSNKNTSFYTPHYHATIPIFCSTNLNLCQSKIPISNLIFFSNRPYDLTWISDSNRIIRNRLFVIYPFNLEDDRPCAIRTTGDHFVFLIHPALHDRASLKTGVDIPADGIPKLRAERHLRFGPPATVSGSPSVWISVFKPQCQKLSLIHI